MNWEIYTYGGGDFLRLIFNGIAQIFGDGDYVYALKSAALIGFIGVLINSAFHRRHLDLAWILGVIMIFQILIVPKTHLVINDRVVPANSAVVENVPLGIAATASIFSKFSDWSTRSFETVFSLPNEIKYSGNGLLFAQTLVEESTRFEITTPSLSANLSDFWKSCVYYDLLLGLYSWSDILRATDLVDFLAQKTSKTRSFTYEQSSSSHNREIITCRDGFNELLKKDIENEIANSTNIQGARLVPNSYNRNEAISRFVSTMPVAYHYLTNLSLSNSKIIAQNILANSFKRGLLNFASDADASAAAEDFAMAKAEAERKTTFSVMGKLAKKMLPILHNIFESFIYAIFPVVMIMAMLPNATKILSKYAMALFWVNLWSPLYAILHFAASYHGQKAATVAMIQAGEGFATGLSIMTNTALGNVLSDYAAITGYLSLSIPMISWLVINASGSMMAGLAGRLMEGYDRPVSSAASESSTGNISLGQFHYQNQTSFQSNIAPQSSTGTMSIQNQNGVMETITSSGQYFRSPLSSLPISIDFSTTTSKALRNAYSESKSYEQSMASEQSKMSQFAVGQLSALGQQINESKGLSQMFNESERNTLSHSNENTLRTLTEMAKKEGISESTAINAAESLGLNAGVGVNAIVADAGIKGHHQQSRSHDQVSSDSMDKIKQIMQSSQFNESVRDDLTKANEVLARHNSDWATNQSESISKTLNDLDQLSYRHSLASRETKQLSELNEHSEQFSMVIAQKGSDAFINWAVTNKGIPQQEFINLVSNFNRGDIDAKREVNKLTLEYQQSLAKDYVIEDMNSSFTNQGEKVREDFNNRSDHFNSSHHTDHIPKWSDEDRYLELQKRVGEHSSTIDPNTQRTQDSIKNEYHNLEGEFDRRKSEEKEDYNRSPLLNMTKENIEKMKKDIDDDVKKIKELTDQRE